MGSYQEKEGDAAMKESKLSIILLLITISMLIFTGCWDRRDIEDRGYVLGIAVDSYTPSNSQAKGDEAKRRNLKRPRQL